MSRHDASRGSETQANGGVGKSTAISRTIVRCESRQEMECKYRAQTFIKKKKKKHSLLSCIDTQTLSMPTIRHLHPTQIAKIDATSTHNAVTPRQPLHHCLAPRTRLPPFQFRSPPKLLGSFILGARAPFVHWTPAPFARRLVTRGTPDGLESKGRGGSEERGAALCGTIESLTLRCCVLAHLG